MKTLITLTATILVFSGCSSHHSEHSLMDQTDHSVVTTASMDSNVAMEKFEAPAETPLSAGVKNGAGAQATSAGPIANVRKVIKHATVNFEVDDLGKSRQRILALAHQHHAYVVTSNLANSGTQITQEITNTLRLLDQLDIVIHTIDKTDALGQATGTRVEITIPVEK